MPFSAPARPLLVTADPDLLDDVLRVSAFAGIEVLVVADAQAGRPHWGAAGCVLVGADAVAGCVRSGPPRRADVVVLTRIPDPELWRQAVELGAAAVTVLPAAEEELLELLSASDEPPVPPGPIAAVIGGRGGAGATTLSAALAVTAVRRRSPALLVDGDPLGGGIDLVLGGAGSTGLRWPDLVTARGRLPAGALLAALPRAADVPVLAWDRGAVGDPPVAGSGAVPPPPRAAAFADLPAPAMEAVLEAGRRSGRLVVVDVPRAFDEASRAALSAADLVLLVVPAALPAVAAASCVLRRLSQLSTAVHLIVRGPVSAGVSCQQVAVALGLPLRASLRPEPGLAGRLERAQPPGRRRGGPLTALCTQLVEELAGGDGRAAW